MTRLENVYREKVVPVLQKEFAYSSPMQIPGIVKISLNIGIGSASQNNKLMEEAMAELTAIAGHERTVRHCRTEGRDDPRQEVHRRVQAA